MYYHFNMDNTFIKKGDNMEFLELNRCIRKAKTNFILAETEKEEAYYKAILKDLRSEKQEILKKEFNKSC